MPRPTRQPATPLLQETAFPDGAVSADVFDTATVAGTVDRLIAGRLKDLETLRSIAVELHAKGGNEAMHRQLLLLARSARDAVDDLQKSRDILVGRHRQASGGKVIAAVDGGTGLANRAAFMSRLSDMLGWLAPSRTLSLMVIELGALQLLANEAGPAVASRVVRRLAAILRRTLKRGDYIARIAPHQFAVIFEDIRPEQVVPIALRVHETIRTKLSPSGEAISDILSINIGIAGAGIEPASGRGSADLVEMAQKAIVDARREGRPAIYVA